MPLQVVQEALTVMLPSLAPGQLSGAGVILSRAMSQARGITNGYGTRIIGAAAVYAGNDTNVGCGWMSKGATAAAAYAT